MLIILGTDKVTERAYRGQSRMKAVAASEVSGRREEALDEKNEEICRSRVDGFSGSDASSRES
jgi:hypothetical protein